MRYVPALGLDSLQKFLRHPATLLEVPPNPFGVAIEREWTLVNGYSSSIGHAVDNISNGGECPHVRTPGHVDLSLRTELSEMLNGWTARDTDGVPWSRGEHVGRVQVHHV